MLSSKYDSSFGGTGFLEIYDGLTAVEPDTALEFSATHIPGGNTTVIQTAGNIAQQLDLPIGADAAELSALRGKVGTRATLVYHAGSVSARLIKIKGVLSVYGSGSYKAVLELVLG